MNEVIVWMVQGKHRVILSVPEEAGRRLIASQTEAKTKAEASALAKAWAKEHQAKIISAGSFDFATAGSYT